MAVRYLLYAANGSARKRRAGVAVKGRLLRRGVSGMVGFVDYYLVVLWRTLRRGRIPASQSGSAVGGASAICNFRAPRSRHTVRGPGGGFPPNSTENFKRIYGFITTRITRKVKK